MRGETGRHLDRVGAVLDLDDNDAVLLRLRDVDELVAHVDGASPRTVAVHRAQTRQRVSVVRKNLEHLERTSHLWNEVQFENFNKECASLSKTNWD